MNSENKISVDQLLLLVAEISEELHPGQKLGRSISIDSSLNSELGFDSLSRMELIQRVERNFEVAVSDKALALIETPRDLLRELKSGTYNTSPKFPVKIEEVGYQTGADVNRIPHAADTLNAVLAWQAEHNGSISHVRIIGENEKIETLTYTELYREAFVIANGLLINDFMPGDAVVLMLPTGRDYFVSFFGTLLAGGIPVPIYPPGHPKHLEDHLNRHAKIVGNAGAVIMITREEVLLYSKLMASLVPRMRRIITCEELATNKSVEFLPQPTPEDTAFIQYTSGSTGDPKGVVLSHSNLLANIRAMGQFLGAGPKDVFVSWLPLYHDMGLIGAWLGSLTFGMPLIIMSPLAFLARPERWLWAIHKYKGTISGGPNFSYDVCSSRIRAKDIEGLNLSTWRIAFNGAEAVHPNTLDEFSYRFKAYGFKRESLMPVYGLAENSVGLAFPPAGRGPKFDRIDRNTLINKSKAVPIDMNEPSSEVLQVPACGQPLPGHQIRIVDDTGREVPERRQGRIQFHGPSATSGYFRHKKATAALFDGDWRNSGDIGYLAGGEVHITGREKDLIIRAGRNIFPLDLEKAVGELEGIQNNNVAVFASPHPKTGIDRLVVMAESRRLKEGQISKLNNEIIGLSTKLTGTTPDDIILVPPRSVPKTSSGKIRRQAARALYEKGYASQPKGTTRWQLAMLLLNGTIQTGKKLFRSTGSWFYAGYAWTLIILLAPPVWLGVVLLPTIRQRWVYFRAALAVMRSLACVRLNVEEEGMDKLKTVGPLIIVANHASYIDGAILISSLPGPFHFVAKAELLRNLLTRLFLSQLGTLFVERFDAERSVEDANRITNSLLKGEKLVYFPEGTFTRMPGLLPFHMGAFISAADTDAPILPVVLRGTRSVLRDNSGFPRPGMVHVKALEPIYCDTSLSSNRWSASLELRDKVREVMLVHCGEPDLAHELVFHKLSQKVAKEQKEPGNG